jgi:adenylate kinase
MILASLLLALNPLPTRAQEAATETEAEQLETLRGAASLIGLEFDEGELTLMRSVVFQRRRTLERLRTFSLDNGEYPVLTFTPRLPGMELRNLRLASRASDRAGELFASPRPPLPENLEELAFASIRELAAWIRAGELSCVALTEMFLARLERVDRELHCVIELTPERALRQAEALDAEIGGMGRKMTAAILIEVPEDVIVRRLGGRRTCEQAGHVFHLDFNSPKQEGVCDVDGSKLIVRDDDKPEVIKKRLEQYREKTEPLIDYYEEQGILQKVDGTGEPDDVAEHIRGLLATLKREDEMGL